MSKLKNVTCLHFIDCQSYTKILLNHASYQRCAPLIADLFSFLYERDLMSNLYKLKQYDLKDMFNDTSRYFDDIFTILNPEFEKHIPDIYPTELQLNKANTSDKGTSFLDLNIKFTGSDVHTSVYDKRDDFGFPIVNFPWLSGDVPRLRSYGVYISQLVRFARCCTSVSDFNSRNLQLTSWLLTQGYIYHKFRKSIRKVLQVILWPDVSIWWNIVSRICYEKESLTRSSTVIKSAN